MSELTRKRIQWLHDAADELSKTKLKMTMKPVEVMQITGLLLASMKAPRPAAEPSGYKVRDKLLESMAQAVAYKADSDAEIKPLYEHPPATAADRAAILNKVHSGSKNI